MEFVFWERIFNQVNEYFRKRFYLIKFAEDSDVHGKKTDQNTRKIKMTEKQTTSFEYQ